MLQVLRRAAADFNCETSCGTLLINSRGRVLLGHVIGTNRWDIPKGRQEPFESPLDAALQELWEETGLTLERTRLEEIGNFEYRPGKRLHLYKAYGGNVLDSLAGC